MCYTTALTMGKNVLLKLRKETLLKLVALLGITQFIQWKINCFILLLIFLNLKIFCVLFSHQRQAKRLPVLVNVDWEMEMNKLGEFDFWSFVLKAMQRGIAINQDFENQSYEKYRAYLDLAAAEEAVKIEAWRNSFIAEFEAAQARIKELENQLTDANVQVLRCQTMHIDVGELRKDKARLDWLDSQGIAYGFEVHEGNEWSINGPFVNLRVAIDECSKGNKE